MTVTVTDLFCGAGGSSSGAVAVPGVRVRMAANHWKLAIETHNSNHPETDHDCADLSQVDPRRYPRTDVLWASPECTNHSQARGRRRDKQDVDAEGNVLPNEAAERSRATMWDVVRFAEYHGYRAIIIENVVDAAKWCPYYSGYCGTCEATGQAGCGSLFRAWLATLVACGYEYKIVYLNSMHAQQMGVPAPQSRDRMYVVFWRRGDRAPDLERWTRPRAWCPKCEQLVFAVQSFKRADREPWGRYRQQYVYRCPSTCGTVVEPGWLPAAAAIDWTLRGERIGDKRRPLAAKTMARIEAGLRKYAAADAFLMRHYTPRGQLQQMCTSVREPGPTNTASFVPSLLVPVEGRDNKQAQPTAIPMRTCTARNETGLLVPPGGTWNDEAATTADPFRTRTTRADEALVIPLRGTNTPKPAAAEPLDSVCAAGNHHGLLVPYYSTGVALPTSDPYNTVTTRDRFALVMRNNTGGAEMCTPVDEVVRTITTTGHQSLIEAEREYDVDECLFRMLEPHEIARAMAFPDSYLMLGNKRERVRLAGNAVTPPAARDLIACVVEALTGEDVAAAEPMGPHEFELDTGFMPHVGYCRHCWGTAAEHGLGRAS